MFAKELLHGVATFLPGLDKLRSKGTGGTDSARYCYSVWLRHMVYAHRLGLNTHPRVIAELGPGDSIGMGLAALLSGCEQYYAFDVVEHADQSRNLEVFDQLVEIFRAKEDIPGEGEFARAKPYLDNYSFPAEILSDDRLAASLAPERVERIRRSLMDVTDPASMIRYKVPWYDLNVVEKASVDMAFSQAVLEHVDDLDTTYRMMQLWLKDDAYMSHQVDFKSHGTASQWNGHWAHSDLTWKLIRGRRPYLLNREPYSTHLNYLKKYGFDKVFEKTVESPSPIGLSDVAERFKSMTGADIKTSAAFYVAVKH